MQNFTNYVRLKKKLEYFSCYLKFHLVLSFKCFVRLIFNLPLHYLEDQELERSVLYVLNRDTIEVNFKVKYSTQEYMMYVLLQRGKKPLYAIKITIGQPLNATSIFFLYSFLSQSLNPTPKLL